jgi:choline dehydrogenase
LQILANSLVRRVRTFNRRVVGVEVERFGAVRDLKCDRVVISGGAISTPGILLRSGIGPELELARLGISMIANVPGVAAKLIDHPGLAVFFKPHRAGMARIDHPLIQCLARYTSKNSPLADDMQLQAGSWIPLPGLPVAGVTLACCVGKPRGVGTIRFHSTRPDEKPELKTEFLVDPEDRARAMEAINWIGRLSKTKAITALAKPVYPSRAPFGPDGNLKSALEQITGSGYHPCATAPMGPDSDPMAVTDGRGCVRGVKGLYIADASLMPTVTSSNTNLPTLMIGERMADFLRADY